MLSPMDPNSNQKGKTTLDSTSTDTNTQQIISNDDQTPNQPPPRPSSSTQPSSTEPSSSPSSTPNRNLLQEATNREPQLRSSPSSQRTRLSSIPPSNRRPFFNPQPDSQTQPSPQRRRISTGQAVASEVAASGSVSSHDPRKAAKLRLMKPSERADFRLEKKGRKVKKRRRCGNQTEATNARIVRARIREIPLRLGLTPYERIQKCLAELKQYIRDLATSDDMEEQPSQSLSNPTTANATSTSSRPAPDHIHAESSKPEVALAPPLPFQDPIVTLGATSSSSAQPLTTGNIRAASSVSRGQVALLRPAGLAVASSSEDDEEEDVEYKVEDVIEMLEEYMKRVPRTIGAQEMEDGLLEIQAKVGVAPRPSWYVIMSKSYENMWEILTENFDCDALDHYESAG